jgi:hypothetical protein
MRSEQNGDMAFDARLSHPVTRNLLIEMWKEHARIFIDWTENKVRHRTPVSFNRWLSDDKYRNEICLKISKNSPHEKDIFSTSGWGGGSSFKDSERSEYTRNLKTRWKAYIDCPIFNEFILQDKELCTLSSTIFPDIDLQ